MGRMKNYLIDTNTLIYHLAGSLSDRAFTKQEGDFLDKIIDSSFNISMVTKIEMLAKSTMSQQEESLIRDFLDKATIYFVNDEILEETILIRQLSKIKLPDAMIAATAKVNNFTLISRNEKDFGNISGLYFFNSFL